MPGIMLGAFRTFTVQWVTDVESSVIELSNSGERARDLDSLPIVREGSGVGWECRVQGPRVQPQAAEAGPRNALVATLGSFHRRQQEMTKVFLALCGLVEKYRTF